MRATLSLSEAKAHLSEVVREARATGEAVLITVDGQPAVRLVPLDSGPRPLGDAEIAAHQALMRALGRLDRPAGGFDAAELVQEGRR